MARRYADILSVTAGQSGKTKTQKQWVSLRFIVVLALLFPTVGTLFFFADTVREQRRETAAAAEIESAIRLTTALSNAGLWLSPEGTVNAAIAQLNLSGVDARAIVIDQDEGVTIGDFADQIRSRGDAALGHLEIVLSDDGFLLSASERTELLALQAEIDQWRARADDMSPPVADPVGVQEYVHDISDWFSSAATDHTVASGEVFDRATDVPSASDMAEAVSGLRSLNRLNVTLAMANREYLAGQGVVPPLPGSVPPTDPVLTLASARADYGRAVADYLDGAPAKHQRLFQELEGSATAVKYAGYRERLLVEAGLRDGETTELNAIEYATTGYDRLVELSTLPVELRSDVLAVAETGRQRRADRVAQSTFMAALIFGGTALVALLSLRILLRPLSLLQRQAQRISTGDFAEAERTSWEPREVAIVSDALDDVATTLRHFDGQLTAMGAGAYEDPVLAHATPGPMGQAIDGAVGKLSETTAALRESEETHRALVDYAADGILTVDSDGRVITANPAARKIFEPESAQLIGGQLAELFDDESNNVGAMLEETQRLGVGRVEVQLKTEAKDASNPPIQILGQTLDAAGDKPRLRGLLMSASKHRRDGPSPMSVVVRDITERLEFQRELWKRSRFDDLTGLGNRHSIHERIDHEISRRRQNPGLNNFAVLFVDLDRFKQVNDTYGHGLGDGLLRVVSERLLAVAGAFPADCFVGRVGGDEFVLVVDHGGSSEVAGLGEQIVASLEEPVSLSRVRLEISASVGVAVSGSGRSTASDLLHEADLAVYTSKTGATSVNISGDSQRRAWQRRQELQADLRTALRADALFLELQPVVSIKTGETLSWEALARWDRPGEGLVSPEEFIGVAEQSNLVVDLGRWAINEAARLASVLTARHGAPNPIAVNISWRHVAQGSLVRDVADALAAAQIDPSLLRLELTETQMPDDDAAVSVLETISAMGVDLALDDFGTGYSSITHLRRYPFSILKLDRTLIQTIETDANARGIVEILVNLAQLLDLSLTAEGVEAIGQATVLYELGCDHGQGHLFGRPAPVPHDSPLSTTGLAHQHRDTGVEQARTLR